jgi:cytochrome c
MPPIACAPGNAAAIAQRRIDGQIHAPRLAGTVEPAPVSWCVGECRVVGTPQDAVPLRLDALNGPILSTANATTGTGSYATQTFPIADPGGGHRLYLILQAVTGGPATNLINLNWIEFGGTGVAEP